MSNVITFAKRKREKERREINKITLRNGVLACIWRQRCSAGKINRPDNGSTDYRKSNKVLSWILQSSLISPRGKLAPRQPNSILWHAADKPHETHALDVCLYHGAPCGSYLS